MTVDTLYLLVSEAIQRADTLEELGAPGAAAAHLDVSLLEERIAAGLPASNPEGALARRGAVRAAGAANDWRRARELAERFMADADAGAELREQLASLLADDLDPPNLPVPQQQSQTKIEARVGSERVRRRAITRGPIGPTVAVSRDDIHGTPGRARLRCLPQDAAAGLDVLRKARIRRERPGSAEHRYLDDLISQPWGHEHRVYDDALLDVWVQTLAAATSTSMHCHPRKDTFLLCLEGRGEVITGAGRVISFVSGGALHIEQGAAHRLAASTDMIVVEIETPRDKFDLVRLAEDSRRAGPSYEGANAVTRHLDPLEPVADGPPQARLRRLAAGTRHRFSLVQGSDLQLLRRVMFAISLDLLGILRRDIAILDAATLDAAIADQLYLTIHGTRND